MRNNNDARQNFFKNTDYQSPLKTYTEATSQNNH